MKCPYEIIGVPEGSDEQTIRQAYLRKVREIHPDNFDQVRDRARWMLANEQLKELNEAYAHIKGQSEAASSAGPSRPRGDAAGAASGDAWRSKLGRLKAGMVWFANLPQSVRERILGRLGSHGANRYVISLSGIIRNYIFAAILSVWLYVLFIRAAGGESFEEASKAPLLVFTSIVALLQAWNICHIFKWHKSALRPCLLVTPLYFVEVGLDYLRYWPIWTMTKLRGTNNYTNSSYTGTDVHVEFGSESRAYSFTNEGAYEMLSRTVRQYQQHAAAANSRGDHRFFYEEDDLREVSESILNLPRPGAPTRNFIILSIVLIAHFSFLFTASFQSPRPSVPSEQMAFRPQQPEVRTPVPQVAPATVPTFSDPGVALRAPQLSPEYVIQPMAPVPVQTPSMPSYPELTLPSSGEVTRFSSAEHVAPFKVSTPTGTHYWVKLVEVGTGQNIIAVFVAGGSTVEVDVPVGDYVVKYASGHKWYGTTHLFGPETDYSKADQILRFRIEGNTVSGNAITLYKVRNGNMSTREIAASEF